MTQIPIDRAKKRDSKEWVKGYLFKRNEYFFIMVSAYDVYRIDPSTLAIHFPNMIDKNGKKIFASLSEDGVGGDILEHYKTDEEKTIFIYRDGFLRAHLFSDTFIQKQYYENKDIKDCLVSVGIKEKQ